MRTALVLQQINLSRILDVFLKPVATAYRPLRWLAASLALFVVLASTAQAGRYEIVKGKGVEVCDVYNKYLSTQRDELTCDREFPSDLTDLKRPAWQQLDPMQNKPLIGRIENYLQAPRDEKALKPWRPVYREDSPDELYISELARLALGQVDIDNDGRPETVVRFRDFRCDSWGQAASPRGPRWVAPIVVLNGSKQDVDREKTYPLMQNPNKTYISNAKAVEKAKELLFAKEKQSLAPPISYSEMRRSIPDLLFAYSKYSPGNPELQGYDAFLFKQQAYFDKWDEQEGRKGIHTLSIYRTVNGKTDEVCRYRWQD